MQFGLYEYFKKTYSDMAGPEAAKKYQVRLPRDVLGLRPSWGGAWAIPSAFQQATQQRMYGPALSDRPRLSWLTPLASRLQMFLQNLIYLAGSASAEFFADIALCPFEAVKVRACA